MNALSKFCLVLILYSLPSAAQITDTLEYAREKAYRQEFAEANELLNSYNKNREDVYGLWLQAQVAYWMGDFERSKDLFEHAGILSPDLQGLKLDHGRTLFEMGDIEEAGKLLSSYLQQDTSNPDVITMLAYIDYWKGRTNKAKKAARLVLETDPEHAMALKLLEEIRIATALNLNLSSDFTSDDQPLDVQDYSLTAVKYFSGFFSPSLQVLFRNFELPNSSVESVHFEAGNKIRFGMNGPQMSFSGGFFKPYREKDSIELTGSAAISQQLGKYIGVEISTAWLPYQYTLASIERPLMHQLSSVAVSLSNPESIIAKLAYERQDFPDENTIHTSYFYLLKSVFTSNTFRFDLGYSFNYAHSEINSFQAVEEGVSRPGPISSNMISGVYDPYFSPQNQMVNSALASIRINPTEAIEFKLRTNYGFYAKAEQPVFITSQNPGSPTNTGKTFYEEKYTPVEFFAGMGLNLTSSFRIQADYQYSKLLFYELQRIGLSASYSFMNN